MTSNKEHIKHTWSGLGAVQEGLQQMEFGMNDKQLLLPNPNSLNHDNHHRNNQDGGRHIVSAKTAKLEFPRFAGDDLMEWFNRVEQFFEYQGTTANRKAPMAAYHFKGKANQGLQWLHRTLQEGRLDFMGNIWIGIMGTL